MNIRLTLLLILCFGVVMLLFLLAFFYFAPVSKTPLSILPTITTTPQRVVSPNPIKTSEKLLDSIENRQPLSDQDAIKRASLISRLEGESGVLNETTNYTLSYLKSADVFQVEIKNSNIEKAKLESAAWLVSQGISQENICHLPLAYFPSLTLLQSLKEQGQAFSPLPSGC